MGLNGTASRPRRQIEINSSGSRRSTRQHRVNLANAAFRRSRKIMIRTRFCIPDMKTIKSQNIFYILSRFSQLDIEQLFYCVTAF